MPAWINNSLLAGAEILFTTIPRRQPTPAALAGARIVSHRGERDNRRVMENTFAAFDPLLKTGVWGMEFDLRWTRDDEPVVCHDPHLKRVFGVNLRLADCNYATLRARCPQVPHLNDLLARYGKRLHLMMEIKAEPYPRPERRRARLQRCLQGLTPTQDFHALALDPELFDHVAYLPAHCRLPVATRNCRQISAFALAHGCAGMAGPYLLLRRRRIARHRAMQQHVAVGYPWHRNLLYRELNRGVDWFFSNRSIHLQRILDNALERRQ